MRLRYDKDTSREGCKSSAAGASARKLREFAAAGIIGISTMLGTAAATAQDAKATGGAGTAAAAAKPASAAQSVENLPAVMHVPVEASSHPANATDTATLTTNLVRMLRLRDIIAAKPDAPANGQAPGAERAAYDAAIAAWGSEEAASEAVDAGIARAIQNLSQKAESREGMGPDASSLESRLEALDRSIGLLEASPGLELVGNSVACLLRMMRGGESCTEKVALAPEDRNTVAPPLPLIGMAPFDFGTQFFLSGFNRGSFTMTDPVSAPEINLIFGSPDAAQSALNAWGDALEVLMNSPSDAAAQAQAAHALHDALSQIPSGREIWNSPDFNEAMAALGQGDLRGGLAALRRETTLNAVWSQFGTLNQLSLSQRAVARIRTGMTLRFPEGTNPDEFIAFRRSSDEGRRYPWDVMYYNVGVNYANLLMTGRLQSYDLDFDTFAITPNGPARAVEGQGHAIDGMAGLTFGGTIFRQPVEATLSGRLGYLWWNIETTDAGGHPIAAHNGSVYGIMNLNFDAVGYEGRNAPFRLSRWGLGIFNLNPYLYFTPSIRSSLGNNLRLEHSVTPRYLLFWGRRQEGLGEDLFFQHRIGADLRPLDFSVQQGHGLTWHAGPGLDYSWNAEQGIHTLEPYGHVSLNWTRGLAFDARVGYFTEMSGDKTYHAPNTVTGSLNLVLTPAMWSNGSKSSGSASASAGAGTGGSK